MDGIRQNFISQSLRSFVFCCWAAVVVVVRWKLFHRTHSHYHTFTHTHTLTHTQSHTRTHIKGINNKQINRSTKTMAIYQTHTLIARTFLRTLTCPLTYTHTHKFINTHTHVLSKIQMDELTKTMTDNHRHKANLFSEAIAIFLASKFFFGATIRIT